MGRHIFAIPVNSNYPAYRTCQMHQTQTRTNHFARIWSCHEFQVCLSDLCLYLQLTVLGRLYYVKPQSVGKYIRSPGLLQMHNYTSQEKQRETLHIAAIVMHCLPMQHRVSIQVDIQSHHVILSMIKIRLCSCLLHSTRCCYLCSNFC